MLSPAEAHERLRVLQRVVAGEKAAIREHRERLKTAAQRLEAFEAECRRHGIAIVCHPVSQAQE